MFQRSVFRDLFFKNILLHFESHIFNEFWAKTCLDVEIKNFHIKIRNDGTNSDHFIGCLCPFGWQLMSVKNYLPM